MDDIIQPLISIPTTETTMYIVGFVEFLLSFAFALLWFICFSNYDKQSRIAKKAIIAHAVGWLVLISVGLLLIPPERTGIYLDVYANLALAHIGFMMVLAGVCALLIASVPKTGIALTLLFAVVFSAIGGKGIGDFLSPIPIHAKIDWMSFDDTDSKLSSLHVGIEHSALQQAPSTQLAKTLQENGWLDNITFANQENLTTPIAMDLVQAPYSGYLYLPEEYGVTRYGKMLFGVLSASWLIILLSAFMLLLKANKQLPKKKLD